MGRAKLKMELIPKEKSRRSTYIKRTKGLKKKLHEFTTLCDIDACMILYGDRHVNNPVIWPDNLYKTHRIINRYHRVDKDDRRKRSLNMMDLFGDRMKKMEVERKLLREKNESLLWNEQINGFAIGQLRQLTDTLGSKTEEMNARIALMKAQGNGGTGMVVYTNETQHQIPCNKTQHQIPWYMSSGTSGNHNLHGTTWRDDDIVFQPPLRCVAPSDHFYPSDHPTKVSDKLNMIMPNQTMVMNGFDYGCFNAGAGAHIGNFPDRTVRNLPILYDPMAMQSTENMEFMTSLGSSALCNNQPYLMPMRPTSSSTIDPQSSIMFQPSQMTAGSSSSQMHQQFNLESFDVEDAMFNKYKMDRLFQG